MKPCRSLIFALSVRDHLDLSEYVIVYSRNLVKSPAPWFTTADSSFDSHSSSSLLCETIIAESEAITVTLQLYGIYLTQSRKRNTSHITTEAIAHHLRQSLPHRRYLHLCTSRVITTSALSLNSSLLLTSLSRILLTTHELDITLHLIYPLRPSSDAITLNHMISELTTSYL